VYDVDGQFAKRCNTSMVGLGKVLAAAEQTDPMHLAQADEVILKKLVEDHHRWTGSLRAREILDNWNEQRAKFVKVFPIEYKRALGEMAAKAAAVAV
jgi:glutamate synthase (NADPH) large chain